MKLLRQFLIILLLSLVGEGLHALLPLPVPASVYGLVLMLLCLCTGTLRLDQVERAYLRIEDVPVGMGCRRVPMGQHYLMVLLRSGAACKGALNGRKEGDWVLEQIHAQAPNIKIGYEAPAPGETAP